MKMQSMVTGANEHLGNTLVRALLAQGQHVRAGVRDPERSTALGGLDCQIVRAELQAPDSLRQALQGLANLHASSRAEVLEALNTLSPGHRLPPRAPKALLPLIAWLQEQRAR
ncbi:SDR family oxidoreductase [Pseudomonas sp. BBP2017]|uniref:SDR family oxidoreductase n=1 Tax=Pseudomonas sp. BBP2017 TaxID=2109731 RepID=UPI0021157EDA|nr:NAD(P)H-binding protein [Pseudomonas sp. BBP2017]